MGFSKSAKKFSPLTNPRGCDIKLLSVFENAHSLIQVDFLMNFARVQMNMWRHGAGPLFDEDRRLAVR